MKNLQDIKAKLAKYCAYQERCTDEVLRKLDTFQLTEDQIIELMRWLATESFLDDKRYAHQFVHGKFRLKKWGKIKIRYELKRKGILEKFIENALETEISDQEYLQTVQDLAEKKKRSLGDKKDLLTQKKLQNYLSQKGYEWEVIKEVL